MTTLRKTPRKIKEKYKINGNLELKNFFIKKQIYKASDIQVSVKQKERFFLKELRFFIALLFKNRIIGKFLKISVYIIFV